MPHQGLDDFRIPLCDVNLPTIMITSHRTPRKTFLQLHSLNPQAKHRRQICLALAVVLSFSCMALMYTCYSGYILWTGYEHHHNVELSSTTVGRQIATVKLTVDTNAAGVLGGEGLMMNRPVFTTIGKGRRYRAPSHRTRGSGLSSRQPPWSDHSEKAPIGQGKAIESHPELDDESDMVGVEEKYEEDYYDPDEAEENDDGNEEEINNMVVAIESNPSSDDSNPLQGSDNSQVHRNKSHHQQQQGPGVQYLTYVPSSGWTSQFHGMLRAAILARSLNRTLVLPPITAVNHDSNQAPDTQSWSSFFDLETFMHHTGVKIVDVQELHGPDQIPSTFGSPKCYITNGIGSLRPLDSTARAFLSQYKFDPSMSELEVETCELSELPSAFENMKSERLLCITGAHNMIVPRSQEWDQYGRYLYFAPLVQEFYEKVLRQLRDQMLGNHHIDRDQTIRVSRQRYIIIQARRDDEHSKNCQQHFQHALSNCLPTSQELASTLRGLLIADPSLRGLPVFVSTNENRAKELAEFKEYGWQILDHQDLRTQEQLGIFGPMMIDQLFMMNAQVVVGGKTSSVGAYRR